MCMKNINMNVVFSDIIFTENGSTISLGNVTGKKFRMLQEGDKRSISQIALAMFISATQSKDIEIENQVDPNLVFVFNEKYEVRIRLTETISGVFKDLGQFTLDPSASFESDGLCRNVFNCAQYCLYSDILLPEQKEKEKFVIKLVIRRKIEDRLQDDGWIVQSIFPLKFENM